MLKTIVSGSLIQIKTGYHPGNTTNIEKQIIDLLQLLHSVRPASATSTFGFGYIHFFASAILHFFAPANLEPLACRHSESS